MPVSWNKDNISTILKHLQSLEDYSKRKSDEVYGKGVIEKQKVCVFNILDDRKLEEAILEQLLHQIRLEEEVIKKADNIEVNSSLENFRSKELNLESIFKKELQLMKSVLSDLFKVYELQKGLTGDSYQKKVREEMKLIADFKGLLKNVLDSKDQIKIYVGQLSMLSSNVKIGTDYPYLGLRIPANIKLLDPISKYDLLPFLDAYKRYRSELGNTVIQLKYHGMTKDFMRSQYKSDFLFHKAKNRVYIMYISDNRDESRGVTMNRLTSDEKKGWYGHELKHILWYTKQSNGALLGFTLSYAFFYGLSFIPGLKRLSYGYLQNVERETDTGAINHGLGSELTQGSNYVYNVSKAPDSMKKRYSNVYSPTGDVMDKTSEEYYDKLNSPRNHSK